MVCVTRREALIDRKKNSCSELTLVSLERILVLALGGSVVGPAGLGAIGQAKSQRQASHQQENRALLRPKAPEIKGIDRRQGHPFEPSIPKISGMPAVLPPTHSIGSVA